MVQYERWRRPGSRLRGYQDVESCVMAQTAEEEYLAELQLEEELEMVKGARPSTLRPSVVPLRAARCCAQPVAPPEPLASLWGPQGGGTPGRCVYTSAFARRSWSSS